MNWESSKLLFDKCEVNEFGDIRTVKTKRIRKKYLSERHGRYYISLSLKGKIYTRKVARVVADAHIPNPLNLPEVNHINGIKTDDRVGNLEWCTRLHNIEHAASMGLTTYNAIKLDENKVREIKLKISKKNRSLSNIALEYGVSRNIIWKNV